MVKPEIGPIKIDAKPDQIEIDPSRTAVIVVDMQNCFVSKGGFFDLTRRLTSKNQEIIPRIRKVIEAARKAGLKVVYVRLILRPDLSNAGSSESPFPLKADVDLAMRQQPEKFKDKYFIAGSWGAEIVEELKPQPGDIVVEKPRFSGFSGELDTVLKTFNIKYLIFTGVATNVCVEATIRDAFSKDYWCILLADCCASIGPPFTQDATLFNVMAVLGWVTDSDNLLKSIKGSVSFHK